MTTTEEGGAICYRRSATAIVTEHAEALLDEQTPPELDVTDADTDHGSILTE